MTSQSHTSKTTRIPPSQLNLPPPQTFDILPPLHELLSRIDHSSNSTTSATGIPQSPPTPNNNNQALSINASYADQLPLEPKDLPNQVLPIKNKCKRIPREIEKLPDVERSVEEQREEIRELEEGIRKRREVLRRVGKVAEGLRGGLG